jgi:hypothetical protein
LGVEQKKKSLAALGKSFAELAKIASGQSGDDQRFETMLRAKTENNWFTLENQELAFRGWSQALREENIERWFSEFDESQGSTKKVGLILAGNLPLVGLHDLICVLIGGHEAHVKMSSKDRLLLPMVLEALREIDPELASKVVWKDEVIGQVDAVIATGADNSARYFSYYFKDIPHIIRRNRNSVAILRNEDSEEDLERLGDDIFDYFGQGCRNVSKIFIPQDFDLDRFFKGIMHRSEVNTHHKYMNNYEYNKTVWLLSQFQLLENGFLVLKEDDGLRSPLGTLYYERYDDLDNIKSRLEGMRKELQCVVGNIEWEGSVPFGKTQEPELWDYADGVNTMDFLLGLSK